MAKPRVWLITGASSGFGRAVTEVVLSNGDIAVATARSPSSLDDLVKHWSSSRLLVLKCDVSKREDISAAFSSTYEHFGRCDVVFNNAGSAYVAELETEQDAEAKSVFDVNFWGAAHVSVQAVRAFRELNPSGEGGVLLNNSSLVGVVGVPGLGYYSASKHALEGFTESLAKEIDPKWNIKISLIKPASFKTGPSQTGIPSLPTHPAYYDPSLPVQQLRQRFASGAGAYWGDVNKAARKIFEFSKLESPPLHWPMGKPALKGVKEKLTSFERDIQQFESWSDGLALEGRD